MGNGGIRLLKIDRRRRPIRRSVGLMRPFRPGQRTCVGGQKYAPFVVAAHGRELAAWTEFDVFRPVPQATTKEAIVETRWALTWEVGGKTAVKARLGVNGFQDPDLQLGLVGTAGCVSPRSSHRQLLSLCATKKWESRKVRC